MVTASILQRQKALAVQAGSGSLTDANRTLLNQEFQALSVEVDRIASGTSFNGVSLLSGGIGSKTKLVGTDTLAAASIVASTGLNSGVAYNASSLAIELRSDVSGVFGNPRFTDGAGNILSNSAFDTVNAQAIGKITKFEFTDVTYGGTGVGSGTLNLTLNGIVYSGKVTSTGTTTFFTLTNGNSGIRLRYPPLILTDAGTQSTTTNSLLTPFLHGALYGVRTSTIQGVDFSGTALAGAIGSTDTGNAAIRIASGGDVDIRDFRYEGNGGSADSNILSVQINGRTFTATNVLDTIAATGNGKLQFTATGGAEILAIDFTGITNAITNIRTSATDRQNFINALNIGFSRAGSGLNFTVGSTSSDNLKINYGSASTTSIYNGASLDVASTTSAAAASTALNDAITKIISLRATVGAMQSRFNFASNAIQSSIESQDNARSQILDTDISAESTNFASAQVQLQAGIAVLAQANKLSSNLLKLLGT